MALSPFQLFFCDVSPALSADGQFLSLEQNVEFDVFAFAFVFPGVSAMFQIR
jgi:hypothetical protein